MRESTYHPSPDRLEGFVEGSLERAESVVIEAHVLGCSRCRIEVDEVRALFGALSGLGHFAPAPGFAARVMAGVELPDPWWARAGAWFKGFVPHSRRGWAFASSVLVVPVVSFSALLIWLLSKPYVSGEGLVAFTGQQLLSGASSTMNEVGSALLHSNLAFWFARGIELLFGAGLRGAGTAAALLAAVMALSAWVLYKNLFRTPNRGSDYVTYSF